MIRFIFIFLLSFFATAVIAYGSTDRERRVRVALALDSTPVTEVAAVVTDFVDGYEKAMKQQEVLVVYIGCDGQHPISAVKGAIVAKQAELAGYKKATILVAYPFGNKMLEHKQMQCQDWMAVSKEVEHASRKITKEATMDSPVVQPLNWSASKSDCCSYCQDCKCSDKTKCPNQCLVAPMPREKAACSKCNSCDCNGSCPDCKVEAKKETTPELPGYTFWYKDAAGNSYFLPNGSRCLNGNCPKQ